MYKQEQFCESDMIWYKSSIAPIVQENRSAWALKSMHFELYFLVKWIYSLSVDKDDTSTLFGRWFQEAYSTWQ